MLAATMAEPLLLLSGACVVIGGAWELVSRKSLLCEGLWHCSSFVLSHHHFPCVATPRLGSVHF